VFSDLNNVTAYYLPETTGWDTPFDVLPTMLWNPEIQGDANFGVSGGPSSGSPSPGRATWSSRGGSLHET